MKEIDVCSTCPENSFEESKYYKINWHMIPAKLSYLLNSCRTSINEFLFMYYMSIGFDVTTSWTFVGFQLVTAFVAAPLWSFLADAQGIHKQISVIICTCAVVLTCLQPVLGAVFGDSNTHYCVSNSKANLTYGNMINTTSISLRSPSYLNASLIIPSRYIANSSLYSRFDYPSILYSDLETTPVHSDLSLQFLSNLLNLSAISPEFLLSNFTFPPFNGSTNSTTNESHSSINNYPLLLSIMLTGSISAIFDGTITSFVDSGVLRRMYSTPTRTEYGYQAYMCAIGYAVGALLCALSTQFFVMFPTSCEAGMFIIYFASTVLLLFSTYWLFYDMDLNPDAHSPRIVSIIFTMTICEFKTWIFFTSTLIGGILQGSWYTFIFSSMGELSPVSYLFFIIIGIGALSAVLTFISTHKIVQLVRGPIAAISLSCLIWSIRFVCLAYTSSPFVAIPNYILHGPSLALYTGASYEYIKRNNDPRVYTIMCGLYNGIRMLGVVIANFFGGQVYRAFNGWVFYLSASLLACLWCIVTLSYATYKSYTKTDYELVNISDDDI